MEYYLGEKLKSLRESRNWTQADLAKRLNKLFQQSAGMKAMLMQSRWMYFLALLCYLVFLLMNFLVLKKAIHFHCQVLNLRRKSFWRIYAGNS